MNTLIKMQPLSGGSFSPPALTCAAPTNEMMSGWFRDYTGWAWRPSKMGWMKPVGGLVSAIGMIPTPASPFLLAGGGALATTGTVATASFERKKAEQANENFIESLRTQLAAKPEGQPFNWPLWFSLGATGVGTFLLLKGVG